MDMKEAVVATFREYLLPELESLKSGQTRITSDIAAVNKRLDDVNQHLSDQSRRIDAVREELNGNINAVREELNGNINALREELNGNINALREELNHRMDETNKHIDETNKRLDRLYEVIVRRDEHAAIVIKINELDHEVREIKQRLAA